jgi:hypothetical protein
MDLPVPQFVEEVCTSVTPEDAPAIIDFLNSLDEEEKEEED